jgi:hypothetical protein
LSQTSDTPEKEEQISSNERLFRKFEKERASWTKKIEQMSQQMKDIYNLTDLQIDLYSQRQVALDYSHMLSSHLTRINQQFRSQKIERWEHYTRNYDLRLDKDPKELHIYRDISDIVEKKEYVQNHLDFMRGTVATIDTMCYGLKHRIALEEYRRG